MIISSWRPSKGSLDVVVAAALLRYIHIVHNVVASLLWPFSAAAAAIYSCIRRHTTGALAVQNVRIL